MKWIATHATLVFYFDLDNNTDADYQLHQRPGNVVMIAPEVQWQFELR